MSTASSSIYTEGQILALYTWSDHTIPATYNSYIIQRGFDLRYGAFPNGDERSTSLRYASILITPPEGEEWDVRYEFQTNLRIRANSNGIKLLWYFVDTENVRNAVPLATTSLYYSNSTIDAFYTPHLTMTRTITHDDPKSYSVALRVYPNGQAYMNYYPINEQPTDDGSSYAYGNTTWFKAILVARRRV